MKSEELKLKQKNPIILILSTVVLALLVTSAVVLHFASREPVQEGHKRFTVTVDFPGEQTRTFELATDEDYLGAALLQKGLISGTESEYGLMVDTVDGLYADPQKGQWWVFTKSGEWVTSGVEQTPVADGDCFEFFLYEE